MSRLIARFLKDESGAVTVDWVVLAAGVIALGMLVFNTVTVQSVSVGANHVSNVASTAGNQTLN